MSEFLATRENSDKIFRNEYVKLKSNDTVFIGRIVEGPYFIPEEVSRESAFAQTSILKGNEFKAIPNYFTLGRIEILGEKNNGELQGTNRRPLPKTPVEKLTVEELQSLIGIGGDVVIGEIVGYPNVNVILDSQSKKVLPRNIGIFGTVGSGKTNTAQVLIEEASKADYAVIVFDVEGEYVEMDKPTNEEKLFDKLKKYYPKPKGLSNFKVYCPAGSEKTRNGSIAFDIKFDEVDPYIISEIAGLEDAQEQAFFQMIDRLRNECRKKKKEIKSKAISFLEGGEHVDVGLTLKELLCKFPDIENELRGVQTSTKNALWRKLDWLTKWKIFDVINKPLEIKNLIKPGLVNIIDVSTVPNDAAKNIAIAETLRKIFNYKVTNSDSPKTLIIIEEAHTFISRENRDKMAATMDMLKLIARRGRKRWLCLTFVSQQPSHIPDEIFELCNTRIIHSIKSEYNLNPLRRSSGEVISEIWDMIPTLGPGQAAITSPQFNHTILVNIRPAMTKRKFIE